MNEATFVENKKREIQEEVDFLIQKKMSIKEEASILYKEIAEKLDRLGRLSKEEESIEKRSHFIEDSGAEIYGINMQNHILLNGICINKSLEILNMFRKQGEDL